jgi:hypothetical protein
MSRENVEIVRRIYEAWGTQGTPLPSGLLDREVEWINPEAVEPGTRRRSMGSVDGQLTMVLMPEAPEGRTWAMRPAS